MRDSALVLALAWTLGSACGPGESGPPPAGPASDRGASPAPGSVAERLARADEFLGKDRLAEAATEFRAVLAGDERNVLALVGLSRVATRMEDGPGALHYLARAAEIHPQDGEIANELGVALVACGRRSEAASTFERAARLVPENPLVLLNAAQNRAELGEWAAAGELAKRAAEMLPNDATPWLLLGRYEMRQEKFAAAVPYLQEASRRAPDNAIVHYHLGKSLAAAGQAQEAREAFRIALGGHPPEDIRKEIESLLGPR